MWIEAGIAKLLSFVCSSYEHYRNTRG